MIAAAHLGTQATHLDVVELEAADRDDDEAQPDDGNEMSTFEMCKFRTHFVNTPLRPVLTRLSAKSHHALLDVGRSILWSE